MTDWQSLLAEWEAEHPPQRRCDWVCDHSMIKNSARVIPEAGPQKCLNPTCDNDIAPTRTMYCSDRCVQAVYQRRRRARRRMAA